MLLATLAWYCLWQLPGSELADFAVYREAARALLRGDDMYLVPFEVSQRNAPLTLGYLYPPLLAAALSWGERAAPELLPTLWCAALFVSVLVSIGFLGFIASHLCVARATSRWAANGPAIGSALFVLLWPPLWDGLMWGQVNPIVLALVAGSAACLLRSQFVVAGSLLAAATALKASPAVLMLPVLITLHTRESRRALFGFLFMTLICAGMSTLSPRGTLVFLDFAGALESFSREPLSIDPYYDYGIQKLVDLPAAKAIALGIITMYALTLIRLNRYAASSPERRLCLGICAGIPVMILAAPCVWFHHLLWLTLPMQVAFLVWGMDPTLRRLRPLVATLLALSLGLSLYAHVIMRHHFALDESYIRMAVPGLIFLVFLSLLYGLSRTSLIHYSTADLSKHP